MEEILAVFLDLTFSSSQAQVVEMPGTGIKVKDAKNCNLGSSVVDSAT